MPYANAERQKRQERLLSKIIASLSSDGFNVEGSQRAAPMLGKQKA
jgi:hypothetical protein